MSITGPSDGSITQLRWRVDVDHNGQRLDQVVAQRVASRRVARRLIELGAVYVDGARSKVQSRSIYQGQRVEVWVQDAPDRAVRSDSISLAGLIAYEDDDIVVVDKPSGMFTAATRQSDHNNLARYLEQEGRKRVWVVHRLDCETSGLVMFAKSSHAAARLSEVLQLHQVDRRYQAVLAGSMVDERRTIDAPIDGRSAITHVEFIEKLHAEATLVRCMLETGRTHQIRIHCAAAGYPVLGDRRYGRPTGIDPPRLALHAHQLELKHPRSGKPILLSSPLPADLQTWIEPLRAMIRSDRDDRTERAIQAQ